MDRKSIQVLKDCADNVVNIATVNKFTHTQPYMTEMINKMNGKRPIG
ncbi:MAG: hypothetical protein SGI83_01220 [Bacteroidota bacterium]|nr:hypothetical protein [Bacteroidota bacterium]